MTTIQPEGLTLDPAGLYGAAINLSDFGTLRLDSFEPGIAKKRPEWASSGDSDGGLLVRQALYDNAEGSFRVRVRAASMDAAMSAIGTLALKLQECENLSAGGGSGLPALWTPAGATAGLTMYLLLAEITDRPITVTDGWLIGAPVLTVSFTRKPFLYGSEITGPTVTSTQPILSVDIPNVPGDVDAEARAVLTDGSTQARRFAEWGIESRFYTPASPAPVLIDSEDLATAGFAGVLATRTGGYRRSGATHDTVSAQLPPTPVAVCGTGNQLHVGTWRIKARLWCASINQYWRLAYQTGDGGFTVNDWVQPIVAGGYCEVDLGVISVPPIEAGSQKWSGRIEAYSANGVIEAGDVDYLLLYPAEEGYGRVTQPISGLAALVVGYDDFAGHASGSALSTQSGEIGGAWTTAGATTDFVSDGSGNEKRTTTADTGPRFAVLGTSYTDTQVDASCSQSFSGSGTVSSYAIARYIDTSNYAFARLRQVYQSGSGGGIKTSVLEIGVVIAGAETVLATANNPGSPASVRATARANGQLTGYLLDAAGNTIVSASGSHSSLQTGGTLQTGKPGFADKSNVSSTRLYAGVTVTQPAAEQFVINSGRALEIRSDSTLRQSTDGASYGDIPSRGSRLFIPPAGAAGRTTRIVARSTRANLTSAADTPLGDSLTLVVFYTPRYVAVPRS